MAENGAPETAAEPVQDEPMNAQADEPVPGSQGDAQPAPAQLPSTAQNQAQPILAKPSGKPSQAKPSQAQPSPAQPRP